ncbi:LTA synthase family protein [Nocardioides caeni]|uniref:LTA synthase family protein n=1 Tax=Nocardioides caeni TaxID=574700 RepID=A0A4S8N0E1_9ACTN|nr:LTA synthase family protein [Nocardioides caeni]THV09203.1 LTA synthase family protein [Nocardioides caeni]
MIPPKVARLLPPGHWFYLLCLLVPVALVDLACQTMRLTTWGTTFGSLTYFEQIRSDVVFHVGHFVFWVGVFHLVQAPKARRRLTILFHVWFTVLSFFIVIAQVYWMQLDVVVTYQSIQLVTLLLSVSMFKIIAAEIKGIALLIPVLGIILANRLPLLINRRRWEPRRLSTPAPELTELTEGDGGDGGDGEPESRTPRRFVAIWSAALVVLLVAALLPDGQGTTNATRNRVLAIPAQAISDVLRGDPDGYVAPNEDDLPIHTDLVPTSETRQRNVVMIMLESTSWHATTLGTPERATTPFLAELAQDSLEGTRAYTTVPHTSKALVGANCGVMPPLDTGNTEVKPGGIGSRCLASLLADEGYATAFFQTATENFEHRGPLVEAFGFQEFSGLESYEDKSGFDETNTLGYEDDLMLQPSLDWAVEQKDAGKPFMLEYMTLTAHTQYVLPEGFEEIDYVDDPIENLYLNTVRYQDEFVQQVVEGFKELGLYKDTVFVIMGDHGEGFREHGRRLHNDTIWNEGTQIPYLIHAPGLIEGQKVETPFQALATLPTVADLLGYDIKGGTYPGASVLADPSTFPRLFISCWSNQQCATTIDPQTLRQYIYFYGFHASEYYDLGKDPLQENDLHDELDGDEREELENYILRQDAETKARNKLSRELAAE